MIKKIVVIVMKVVTSNFAFVLYISRMKVAEFDYVAKCDEIAHTTEGLSGREISKLGVAWQVSKYCSTVLIGSLGS